MHLAGLLPVSFTRLYSLRSLCAVICIPRVTTLRCALANNLRLGGLCWAIA